MDPGYALHVSAGALRSLSRARPITRVLDDNSVTPEQARKLRLVLRVRAFAEEHLGLHVARAYSKYEDNARRPVAWSVSAAHRDRLEAYRWNYPIIGRYEARGFFDPKPAQREAERLRQKGLDVLIARVDGFSTLGMLPDPVRASNLKLDDIELVILILHELTHNTIYKPNDTLFNETMAAFVGRAAAIRFYEESFGPDSAEAAAARKHVANLGVIDDYVIDLHTQLVELYAEAIARDEKLRRREAIFRAHRDAFATMYAPRLSNPRRWSGMTRVATTNATILAAHRYHAGQNVFQAVLDGLNGDLVQMLAVLSKAARKRDSQAFLRGIADADQPPGATAPAGHASLPALQSQGQTP